MVLLVNIDNFDPSLVLVNINKLQPYVPYDDNTRKLKIEFQGGKGEGTTLETQESLEEFMEDEDKIKRMKERVANKRKHMTPYNLIFHKGRQ